MASLKDCPFFTSIWRSFYIKLGLLQSHGSFVGLCLNWMARNFPKRPGLWCWYSLQLLHGAVRRRRTVEFSSTSMHLHPSVAYEVLHLFNLWSKLVAMHARCWNLENFGAKLKQLPLQSKTLDPSPYHWLIDRRDIYIYIFYQNFRVAFCTSVIYLAELCSFWEELAIFLWICNPFLCTL